MRSITTFDPSSVLSSVAPALSSNEEAVFGRQKELLWREVESFDTQQPYQHAK
jgi:hypothetical protein